MQNHSQNVYDELVKSARFYNELYGMTSTKDKEVNELPNIEKVRKHYNMHSWG